MPPPTVLVISGVSASGKSEIAGRLAAVSPGSAYHDADAFHSPANKAKMAGRVPLSDADRAQWLANLNGLLVRQCAARQRSFLACSALKQRYRRRLTEGCPPGAVDFVLLAPPREELERRLREREALGRHFMPAVLLESQLADLEVDPELFTITGTPSIEETLRAITARFRLAEGLPGGP